MQLLIEKISLKQYFINAKKESAKIKKIIKGYFSRSISCLRMPVKINSADTTGKPALTAGWHLILSSAQEIINVFSDILLGIDAIYCKYIRR